MQEVYLGISVIIGLVVILDGYLVIRNRGVVEKGQLAMYTTTIEFLWALVSIVALVTLNFEGWQVLVPVLYITHNVIGWAYGFYLQSKSTDEEFDKVEVPIWYGKFGLNFGVVFTFSCVLVQFKMYS